MDYSTEQKNKPFKEFCNDNNYDYFFIEGGTYNYYCYDSNTGNKRYFDCIIKKEDVWKNEYDKKNCRFISIIDGVN